MHENAQGRAVRELDLANAAVQKAHHIKNLPAETAENQKQMSCRKKHQRLRERRPSLLQEATTDALDDATVLNNHMPARRYETHRRHPHPHTKHPRHGC